MNKNDSGLPLLSLLIGSGVLLFLVFKPFLPLLALAAVGAVLLHGPYTRLTRLWRGSEVLSALSVVGLVLLFCVAPLLFLALQISQEAQRLYVSLGSHGVFYVQTVETALRQLLPGFTVNLQGFVSSALVFVANNLGSLLYQTLSLFFATFLLLLALFFFLRDGARLAASFSNMSPFGDAVTKRLVTSLYETTRSIVRGTLLIVIIRWVSMWALFWLFGIPNALLWGSVGAVLGAIPGLGTAFGFVGAVAYLYLAGSATAALLLALLGVGVVIAIDNVLTSYFFGKGLEVSPLFVLFSILGGIVFFGPLGFIFGPLVLSVFLSVVHAYDAPAH